MIFSLKYWNIKWPNFNSICYVCKL